MAAIMNAIFRAKDEISPVLNNMHGVGNRTLAGMEDLCTGVSTAMNGTAKSTVQVSASLASLSGNTQGVASQLDFLGNAALNEADKVHQAALKLQFKADKDERAAEAAVKHYTEIQNEISATENVTDAMKQEAEVALQQKERLEQVAIASRKKADAAEIEDVATRTSIQSTAEATRGQEQLAASIEKSASVEQAAANSLNSLSGNSSALITPARMVADAMLAQAEKSQLAATTAREKADADAQAAIKARELYNKLKEQITATKEADDALANQAAEALKLAESLEKVAQKSERKALKSEESAQAALNNADALEKEAQDAEKLSGALNKAEHEAEEYANATEKAADSSDELGQSGANAAELLQDAFATIGVMTALKKIEEAFISAASASIEFESAITGVFKTVDGTDEQLARISDEIKAMSLVMPATTTEIAGVAESAGQLGIATEDITKFTEVMINLGEATNLSSDEAASSLAKFSNITGMSAANYENLGSTVVALGNNFATTEADIVAMATRMASAGTLAGLTESEILGLAASMSSVGIEADAGGSAMSKLLTDIQVAVETGNESLEDFASVAGMTCEQFADAFGNNAAGALYSFIDGLNDVERNGETATVILENMGITEVRLSNAVKSLASNSNGLASAVSLAGEAWEDNTALANEAGLRYGTLESRLAMTQNAANNLKIAVGDVLTPTIGEFADMGTEAIAWMTGFVEDNPEVVAVVTALATVLGVGAVALTAYTVATKIATAATKAFNFASKGNVVFSVISGVVALGGAIAAATSIMKNNAETVEDYNGTLEQCRLEIEDTEVAYANVCKMYGSNSDAAKNLASELDILNAQYQKGGGYLGDLYEQSLAAADSMNSLNDSLKNQNNSIDTMEIGGLKAISTLERLAGKSEKTSGELDLMQSYADYLNDTFNCNIEVNYDTGELTNFDPTSAYDNLDLIIKGKREAAAVEFITDPETVDGFLLQHDNLSKANDELEKIKNSYGEAGVEAYKYYRDSEAAGRKYKDNLKDYFDYEDNMGLDYVGRGEDFEKFLYGVDEAQKKVNEMQGAFDSAGQEVKDACDEIGISVDELTEGWLKQESFAFRTFKELVDGASKVGEAVEYFSSAMTPQEAAGSALSDYSEQILDLCVAYEDAYNAAYESFQGQFGLFDKANANTDATVEKVQGALDSQLNYWNQYEENINYLANTSAESLGVTKENYDAFMAYVRSGSEDAAGLVDDVVSKLEDGNVEAVASVMNTRGEIDSKQQEIADTTADWITDYDKKIQDFVDEATQSIGKLDTLEGDAKDAAVNTVNAYANNITATKDRAVSAAQSVVDEVKAVFANSNITLPVVGDVSGGSGSGNTDNTATLPGHATGTTYAEDIYIAGEEGPELIIGKKGSTVFPADETNRIISAMGEQPLYVPPTQVSYHSESKSETTSVSRKEISLDINGKGSVNVQSNMGKEQVVEILYNYLKPALMEIVEQDIFEEGEGSYEF